MTKIRVLDQGEFDQLLAEVDTISTRDALVLCLLHDSAMRIEDALTVRLQDFSPDRTLVRVWDGKHRDANEYDTLPVSRRTIDRLELWLPQRPVPARESDRELLILSASGRKVWGQHYRRLLEREGQRVLGRRVWPHLLRHTSITELACDHGVPLPTVQAFARHRSLATTERYVHVRPGWAEGVRDIWDGALRASG
jgi:integrase